MLEKVTFLGGPAAGKELIVDGGTDLLYIPYHEHFPVSPNYKDEMEKVEFEVARYRRDAVKKNVFRVDG